MGVRQSVPGDWEDILELYQELFPTRAVIVSTERIQEFLDDKSNYLLVYELNGVAVATVTVNICLNAVMDTMNYAIFENFIVSSKCNNKGLIGFKLFEYCEKLAKKHNCSKIMLLSSVKRVEVHEYLRRLGYSDEIAKGFKKYLVDC